MCNFSVGQDVICIVRAWGEPEGALGLLWCAPSYLQVVTIREIDIDPDGYAWLRFAGLVSPTVSQGSFTRELCFDHAGFRPVAKTDISEFTAMLAPRPRIAEVA